MSIKEILDMSEKGPDMICIQVYLGKREEGTSNIVIIHAGIAFLFVGSQLSPSILWG